MINWRDIFLGLIFVVNSQQVHIVYNVNPASYVRNFFYFSEVVRLQHTGEAMCNGLMGEVTATEYFVNEMCRIMWSLLNHLLMTVN